MCRFPSSFEVDSVWKRVEYLFHDKVRVYVTDWTIESLRIVDSLIEKYSDVLRSLLVVSDSWLAPCLEIEEKRESDRTIHLVKLFPRGSSVFFIVILSEEKCTILIPKREDKSPYSQMREIRNWIESLISTQGKCKLVEYGVDSVYIHLPEFTYWKENPMYWIFRVDKKLYRVCSEGLVPVGE